MKRAFLLWALLIGAACTGDQYGPACTLIGCEDGLSVDVQGDLPASYTVSLEAAGMAMVEYQCTAAAPCSVPHFVPDFTPETVVVRVQGGGVDYSETVTPEYTISRPNGPDCPPECQQATIVVQVP